jgi:hypothetical protein
MGAKISGAARRRHYLGRNRRAAAIGTILMSEPEWSGDAKETFR